MGKLILTVAAIATLSVACAPSEPVPDLSAGASVPWQHHCTLDGIQPVDEQDRKFLEKFSHDCQPVDACILSCIRSSCAKSIKGGCFHMCSSEIGKQDSVAADQFQARTAPTCELRPNNSFKPKPLRGSA